MWIDCTGGAHRRIHLATAHANQTNEMGSRFTLGRALVRDDSNCGRFSLELSMAAALPSRPRALCRGSAAAASTIADRFRFSPTAGRHDNSDVDLRHSR